MEEFDYIIVGQGLAGSAFSYQLLKAGRSVLVFDDARQATPSRVAAGLYNPVTGRKMVKTWAADMLFPYLRSFYKELEQVCSAEFLVETPIYRPFISLEEQNEWMGKSASEDYVPYIKKIHRQSLHSFTRDPFGGVELAQSGFLRVSAYLHAYRNFLEKEGALEIALFNPNEVIPRGDRVVYREYQAKHIIFCDGPGAIDNPFFKWLPFRPVKGEILEIESDMQLKSILNRGVFVIPTGDKCFRVGSNYDNTDLTAAITDKARSEITHRLDELIDVPYTIVRQEAGVRPATKDRRPFVGLHPDYKTIGVLNGLGTKGVSLAPYFSRHLYEFLEKDVELHPEVNISRYF